MWPMLLNLTRDECRRTLRSLELEAYSNVMSVFRAQGPLEENRKKILEELRAVLHISQDRHSAEARRVSNDELLATIADKLCGPYTGLGWISEGRRRVPLLPRGVPQTMYTELADKGSAMIVAENSELQKRLDAEKLVAPKSTEEEVPQAEGQTAESAMSEGNELEYPPIAVEDPTVKLWDTELICRKRKPESGTIPDDAITPIKNVRNIPINPNQKHVNLSQLYSKFSQPATSKPLSQSKHSYNQVSKVSTSKSNHPPTARVHKQRSHKISKSSAQHMSTKQLKKQMQQQQEPLPASPSKHYNVDFTGPPNTFQASYAQAVLGKQPPQHGDTPPEPTPPPPQKASQFVIKKRPEIPSDKKVQTPEVKTIQRPVEGIKLLSSRPLVVTPGSTPRPMTPGKLIATKVIGSIPKTRPTATPIQMSEKMIVVSKPPSSSAETRPSPAPKLLVTSGAGTPMKEGTPMSGSGSVSKISDAFTPKGIPATDLKVSAKTFVLNPKSGQKMVVVPARARTKSGGEGQYPVLHFKGMPSAMKLVPVSSQSGHTMKTTSHAVTSKLAPTTVTAGPKVIGVETIKTANMADIVPVKGLPPVSATKITNPIVRASSTKGGVIVVQKGATLGKALTFTKNGNDMSKIIMGKNVNQLLQAKSEHSEQSKAGNVIVLELNNEQSGRTTTVSEILESASAPQVAAPAPPATDWAMELEPSGADKAKHEDKLNSLHLDLGMSSDSDADYPRPPEPREEAPPTTSGSSGTMTLAARTLLSQLQDEGSSSNDSSFALKPKHNRSDESDALAQAKEKLSEKVEADKARLRRIDVYSTAITPTDINLDSFSYLEDDDEFDGKRPDALSEQLSRLLDEPPPNVPLNKQ